MGDKIKLVIKRKPAPPPLPAFRCIVCEDMVERDPYQPHREKAPICVGCCWRMSGRVQTRQLPFSMWADFHRFHAVLHALEKEIDHARRTH